MFTFCIIFGWQSLQVSEDAKCPLPVFPAMLVFLTPITGLSPIFQDACFFFKKRTLIGPDFVRIRNTADCMHHRHTAAPVNYVHLLLLCPLCSWKAHTGEWYKAPFCCCGCIVAFKSPVPKSRTTAGLRYFHRGEKKKILYLGQWTLRKRRLLCVLGFACFTFQRVWAKTYSSGKHLCQVRDNGHSQGFDPPSETTLFSFPSSTHVEGTTRHHLDLWCFFQ